MLLTRTVLDAQLDLDPFVYALRRDWPDGHEYVMARGDERAANRALRRDRGYWQKGPIKPTISVVHLRVSVLTAHLRRADRCLDICPDAAGAAA